MSDSTRGTLELLAIAAVALLSGGAAMPRPAVVPAIPCAELAAMDWGGFRIDVSELRSADEETPRHCFVRGTIDAEIRFELLLPGADVWNGRFVMGGGGGFVGTIDNQAMQAGGEQSPLELGYATVGTDTGHEGTAITADWALAREDREINWGYRAVHLTGEVAKTVVRLHYGRDIDYSYFVGCSNGGRQAMMESQRYPDDFDGIVAGAPAYSFTGAAAQFLQTQQAIYPVPDRLEPVVTPALRELLSRSILDACDDLDGVADGVMTDPRDCGFDPERLPRCSAAGSGDCVTEAQIAAVMSVYSPVMGREGPIYPGFPLGGENELGGWGTWVVGGADMFGPGVPSLHAAFGAGLYKYVVFDDPDWDYSQYDLSRAFQDSRRAAELVDATSTDLSGFETAGGKLIIWNGWSDLALSALSAIEYYEGVESEHPDAESFVRLFLLPGVLHCGGGAGPDRVEWLEAIRAWVEDGESPERLIATKRGPDGEVQTRRPLCAHPARAVYDGVGDPARPESFRCVEPM